MDVKVKVPPVPPAEVAVGLTAVGVRVNVAVADRAIVGVRVGVGPEGCVAVFVDVGALAVNVTTNCGGLLPSREENITLSLLSPPRTKLYVPLPATRDVTSYSTQVLVAILPWLPIAPLVSAGRLFHVIPVSDQLLPVA